MHILILAFASLKMYIVNVCVEAALGESCNIPKIIYVAIIRLIIVQCGFILLTY